MIRNGSALLGAGLLLAGLTTPLAANARSDDTALAFFLGTAVGQAATVGAVRHQVVHVNHHHHHHPAQRGPSYRAPLHRAPVRILPVHAPSPKAQKKHDAAYRKWQQEHIKLYGHAPRGYPCHHSAPPRHHYGRR